MLPIYVMWFYSVITAIGTGLLTTFPTGVHIPHSFYGYEFLAGFGLGGTFSIPMLLVPYLVHVEDLGMLSANKFREIFFLIHLISNG